MMRSGERERVSHLGVSCSAWNSLHLSYFRYTVTPLSKVDLSQPLQPQTLIKMLFETSYVTLCKICITRDGSFFSEKRLQKF